MNPKREYKINDSIIPCVNSIRDIGIEVDQTLKFSQHCKQIAQKANALCNLFFLTFRSRDRNFMLKFYTTYVRPLLETATTVWNPHLMKDIDIIEKVQRKFTKRIPGMFIKSYKDRRFHLQLTTLEQRRMCNDLIMTFKIIHGLIKLDFQDFFEFNLRRNLRGHSQKLIIPKFHKNCLKYDFCSRTAPMWNMLTEDQINSSTLECFRRRLNDFDFSRFLRYPDYRLTSFIFFIFCF